MCYYTKVFLGCGHEEHFDPGEITKCRCTGSVREKVPDDCVICHDKEDRLRFQRRETIRKRRYMLRHPFRFLYGFLCGRKDD